MSGVFYSEVMSWNIEEFKAKLESQHSFPGTYIFKFIVPSEKVELAKNLWSLGEIIEKPSSKGKYVSVTIKGQMASVDEVIRVYENAHKIEGLIAL